MSKRTLLERQRDRIDRRMRILDRAANRTSWLRLGAFLLTIALSFMLGNWPTLSGAALLVGGTGFAVLVALHRRHKRALARLALLRAITVAQLARLTFTWKDLPPAPPHEPPADHPYAADLDLLGERSLLHLIDATVARESSDRLRDWLLTPPDSLATSRDRQALVRELVPLRRFRHRLTIHASQAAGTIKRRWETAHLLTWAGQPLVSPPRALLIVLALLAAANIALFWLEQARGIPPYWGLTFAAYAFLSVTQLRAVLALGGEANALLDGLRRLGDVLGYLETVDPGPRPRLQALCAAYRAGDRPSTHLRRIAWVVSAASLQRNPLLWLTLNAIVPWDIYFAYRLERLRAGLAHTLPGWLDSWFTLEAASALANFADLHPENVFPVLSDDLTWRGTGLRHPLIAAPVANDFAFTRLGDVALVTGSNMSGKSSFLRTLGVNMVLAYAGGPVCADALTLSHFRLFTQMRVSDSITEGYSYFYAEVRRLARLLDALADEAGPPLVFLVDEIFRGTNNRERLIGSRSFIRALAGRRGMGVIATHDLELTKLADELAQVRNFHFEDQVSDGHMTFDYTLRAGASTSTNALTIMRLVGLPVDEGL